MTRAAVTGWVFIAALVGGALIRVGFGSASDLIAKNLRPAQGRADPAIRDPRRTRARARRHTEDTAAVEPPSVVPQSNSEIVEDDDAVPSGFRELRELFAEYGREDDFRRLVGAVPVHPVGVSIARYRDWQASSESKDWLAEPLDSAIGRVATVNRALDNSMSAGTFSTFAVGGRRRFEVILGDQATSGHDVLEQELTSLALQRGARLPWVRSNIGRPISPDEHRAFDQAIFDAEREIEVVLRDAYRSVRDAASRRQFDSLHPSEVSALLLADGVLTVHLRGADPDLDGLVEELERLEAEADAHIDHLAR